MRPTGPWPNGVPCWADLNVPDVPAAQAFYSTVLGWQFDDSAAGELGGYLIGRMDGAAAAGLGPLPRPGVPSAWTLYFAADDADAVSAAVTAAGGTVLLPPGDVGPMGRMCIAADPSGAVFGVWQAGTLRGAGVANEPGALTWEDLRSTDPDAARAFYGAVFGYGVQPLADAGPDYTTFSLADERPLGGIGGMLGAEGLPSHWAVYFAVPSVTKAISAAGEAGGEVVLTDFNTPYGSMAELVDPFGASFWIIDAPAAG